MAIAVTNIGHNSGTGAATITLSGVTVPAGSLICVLVMDGSTAASGGSLSDGGSNTYTSVLAGAANNVTTNGFGQLFYAWNTVALSAATLTYTIVTSSKPAAISAFYATGIQASSDPYDSAVGVKAFGSSVSPAVTSGTPVISGELIVTGVAWKSKTTDTLGLSGSFVTPFISDVATSLAGVGGGNLVNAGTSTTSLAGSITATDPWLALIVGFKAAAQATGNTDWPNPRGYLASTALLSFADRFKLNLIGKDRFFGAPGQPPANLDWPNPRGYVPAIELRTWLQGFRLLVQVPMPPPALRDWPNPVLGAVPSILLRTHIDTLKLNLAGTDRFFGGPGQPPANLDWPNPNLGAARSIELRTWLQAFQIEEAGPLPSWDWPNPRGYVPAISLRTHIDSLKPMFGSDTFFGAPGQAPANLDWPVPKGYVPAISLRTWLDTTKLNLIGQDTFFRAPGMGPTYDYPNPRGYIPGISLRTWTDSLKLNLLGQDKIYGGFGQVAPQFDWPVPKGPRRAHDLSSFMLPFNIGLNTLNLIDPGFMRQHDWPVPRGYIPGISLLTWINQTDIKSIPPVSNPNLILYYQGAGAIWKGRGTQ